MFSISRNIVKCRYLEISWLSSRVYSAPQRMKSAKYLLKNNSEQLTYARFLCSKLEHKDKSNDEYAEIDYDRITEGDKQLEHKLKVIMLETEVMRQEGKLVPDNEYFLEKHWKEMLTLSSRTRRQKYLEYLFKISKKKENKNLKKEENRKALEEFKSTKSGDRLSLEEFAQTYGLQHNNLFLRFYDSTMNEMYNNRLIQAIRFGEKLVIDCGYDQNMTKRESTNCSKQFMLAFSENRYHEEPFDVHFCNADLNSHLMTHLHKFIPTMYEPWFPINVHQESYLDIFPKEQLVYLTPHCQEEMRRYESDSVYIIGGIVDKVNNEPLSLAKAKKEGIRMQKFPLDRYLQWGSGSGKSLTINQTLAIMLDIKKSGDWDYALRHVPRRKLVTSNLKQNIDRATNLRYDKIEKGKRWSPSSNANSEMDRSRMVHVRSIWNE